MKASEIRPALAAHLADTAVSDKETSPLTYHDGEELNEVPDRFFQVLPTSGSDHPPGAAVPLTTTNTGTRLVEFNVKVMWLLSEEAIDSALDDSILIEDQLWRFNASVNADVHKTNVQTSDMVYPPGMVELDYAITVLYRED